MELLKPEDLGESVFNTFRYESDQIEYLKNLIGEAEYLIGWIKKNRADTYV